MRRVSYIDRLCGSACANASSSLPACGLRKGVILMESSLLLLKGTVSSGELSGKQQNSPTTWGLLRSSRAWEKWEKSVKVLPSETSRQMKGTVANPHL